MASNYVFGRDPNELIGDQPRYFYALRRTDDGELYFSRVNQLSREDSIEINAIGDYEDNYNDFQPGVDFFEGRDVNHNLVYQNLNYEQYRWDDRSMYYYIDDDGQLIIRTNTKYQYPTGV
mgnify:CR=1 FL=1